MSEYIQIRLFGEAPDRDKVSALSLDQKVERAIALLQEQEPLDGYYFAFSGGKDSCVCDELLKLSGCAYTKNYHNVTIDPPELVRFIKKHHADAIWNNPKHGNMFHRIATRPGTPPTRKVRWCCEEYKESNGGAGMVKVFGVRADESPRRAHLWREVSMARGSHSAICPIVYWSDADVWDFIKSRKIPYCSLYDEGFKRLGCVGCMLNPTSQKLEFERWPAYAKKWKDAVIKNWENHRGKLRRDGKPYMHARFSSGEAFYQWWINDKSKVEDDCQGKIVWTNADDGDEA